MEFVQFFSVRSQISEYLPVHVYVSPKATNIAKAFLSFSVTIEAWADAYSWQLGTDPKNELA